MNSILQGGARLGGSEQTGVMQSSGPTTNKHCFYLKIVATSAILDELKKFFGQGRTDDHFISADVNMPSLKFVIDRLADGGVNGLNDWKYS